MKRRAMILVLLLLGGSMGLAVAQMTQANFNAATGFSGRHGFTCTSCHNVPDRGPLGDGEVYDPPANLVVEGLPIAWEPEASYRITIRVEGGPPALPNPAPQGGFEIEADIGHFEAPEDMIELVDVYTPGAVTYTVAGTQVRQWAVLWVAPTVTAEPRDVTFWVAAMSANGNHIVAADASAGGELGDSVDNDTFQVAPGAQALEAWDAVRLDPPSVPESLSVLPFTEFRLSGRHLDADATVVGYRINDGMWGRVEAVGDWALQVNGLPPGEHEIWVRSEAGLRVSEAVAVDVTVSEDVVGDRNTPVPVAAGLVSIAAAAILRRRP